MPPGGRCIAQLVRRRNELETDCCIAQQSTRSSTSVRCLNDSADMLRRKARGAQVPQRDRKLVEAPLRSGKAAVGVFCPRLRGCPHKTPQFRRSMQTCPGSGRRLRCTGRRGGQAVYGVQAVAAFRMIGLACVRADRWDRTSIRRRSSSGSEASPRAYTAQYRQAARTSPLSVIRRPHRAALPGKRSASGS